MRQLSSHQLTELAFQSANAIGDLAGLPFCAGLKGLQERVIKGELTFNEAVQLVIEEVQGNR